MSRSWMFTVYNPTQGVVSDIFEDTAERYAIFSKELPDEEDEDGAGFVFGFVYYADKPRNRVQVQQRRGFETAVLTPAPATAQQAKLYMRRYGNDIMEIGDMPTPELQLQNAFHDIAFLHPIIDASRQEGLRRRLKQEANEEKKHLQHGEYEIVRGQDEPWEGATQPMPDQEDDEEVIAATMNEAAEETLRLIHQEDEDRRIAQHLQDQERRQPSAAEQFIVQAGAMAVRAMASTPAVQTARDLLFPNTRLR